MSFRMSLAMLQAIVVLAAEAQDAKTRSLFNGRDLTGWHADVPAADGNPDAEPSFVARGGSLFSLGRPGGHLLTDDVHSNYRLDVEYRFDAQPGNCGVLVHASTPRALYDMFPASIEVQMNSGHAGDFWCIQQNIAVEDMATYRAGDPASWGGGPRDSRRILNRTDDSENDVGKWNRMVIEALDDRVRVWVNGDLVNDGFDCTVKEGRIALQAEGVPVEFRRLDLTPITTLTAPEPQPRWVVGQGEPVKVFILAGQSNMEGKAQVRLLDHQIEAPETRAMFAHLHDEGEYIERDDVWIAFLDRMGPLTVGYGSPDRIGAELEFGHVMGDHFDAPVLLIKTAWGGKSIARDFRPPSAGLPDDAVLQDILERTNENNRKNGRPEITLDDVKGSYGHFYREMIRRVEDTRSNLGTHFPELDGAETELAGLVWFQGWNDQYNGVETEYASNMAHFIRDVRRDLDAPDLPVVIGIMGQNGSAPAKGAMKVIQDAQRSTARLPEFRSSVRAVATDLLVDDRAEAAYPTWKQDTDAWEKLGSDHPYHYLGSAVWFTRIGHAFADAMLELTASRP